MKQSKIIFRSVMSVIAVTGLIMAMSAYTKDSSKMEEEIDDFNFVIGTQTVGAKYKFTNKTMLVETA
ncbi:MAG: hypothetical protein ACJAVY_002535, partial [Marinoscillum sp.]